jgi:hypothetical protein
MTMRVKVMTKTAAAKFWIRLHHQGTLFTQLMIWLILLTTATRFFSSHISLSLPGDVGESVDEDENVEQTFVWRISQIPPMLLQN